ncbi:MAG TPA: exopolysaccharide biosynthesis polyprenyl glycosylphosphotransferase [Longimicrobiales bacterium]
MRIGSEDIRHGGDAAFYLMVRTAVRDVVRGAALVALDVFGLGLATNGVRWLHALVLPRVDGVGAPADALFAYTAILCLAACGGYRAGDDRKNPRRISGAVLLGGVVHAAVLPLLGWWMAWERLVLLTGAAMVAVLELRLLGERVLRYVRVRSGRRRRVVLVGGGDAAGLAQIRPAGEGLIVCGRIDVEWGDEPVGGVAGELAGVLEREAVEMVIILDPVPAPVLHEVATVAIRRGARVEAWFARGAAGHRAVVRMESGQPVIECRPARLTLPRMALKRAMDVAFAAVALLLISPLLAMIAVAIRLDSAGPVLFGQLRVGVGGKPFRMWKFRTMVPDADRMKPALAYLNESGDPRLFKISHDPRVTRVGRWLRRTSLDELPQLINVLRGEMSLVGPRPFFPEDVKHYEPHHLERLTVLPGITGLWQVSGRSDVRDFEAVVNLDREYIRRWSLLLDLRILARTIPAVLRRDGAM